MSAPSEPGGPLEQWFESWKWASTVGWDVLGTMWGLHPPERLRTRLLAEARRTAADYLRSPAFLELMRANLSAMTFSNRLLSPFRIH